MSSFTKPLTVTKIDRRTWRVEKSFTYYLSDDLQGDYVFIPKGFETDFASVPRIFWAIFPPDGQYTQAAVVHDFLYSEKKRKRKKCDIIFYQAMKCLNVATWRRSAIYRAVRMFGWISWNKKISETLDHPFKIHRHIN